MKRKKTFKSLICILIICFSLIGSVNCFATVPSTYYASDQHFTNYVGAYYNSSGVFQYSWSEFDYGPREIPANTSHYAVSSYVVLYIDGDYHRYEGTVYQQYSEKIRSWQFTHIDGSYDSISEYEGHYAGTLYLVY